MDAKAYLDSILPQNKSDSIWQYLISSNCTFRVAKQRKTKRGDFKSDGKSHKISVNQDANKYRFLLTLIHEIAHLKTFIEYKRKAKPHGKEWKSNFSLLFSLWKMEEEFQDSKALLAAVVNEKNNANACSGVDFNLERALAVFDEKPTVLLGDLLNGTRFIFKEKVFSKITTRRTRCLCIMESNNKQYTISAAAQVDVCG